VRPTLVVGQGPSLYLAGGEEGRSLGPFLLDPDPRRAAQKYDAPTVADLPPRLRTVLEALPEEATLVAFPSTWAKVLTDALHRPVGGAPVEEVRRARRELGGAVDPVLERRFFLALGQLRLERALRSPEEILITLAREEERVERALGRESRAAESFVPVPRSPLDRHLATWGRARSALGDLAEELRQTLETEARQLVPNLSTLVGPRTAARLVAAAGGVAPLARMPAPRLQLLGSRRRPSPDRGPRFGLLYRADRLAEVPLARRGAYARSLAALAAIAVRADASTHRDISADLVARRDRRIETLRRRSR